MHDLRSQIGKCLVCVNQSTLVSERAQAVVAFMERLLSRSELIAGNPDVRYQLRGQVLPALQEGAQLVAKVSESAISTDGRCSLLSDDLFAKAFASQRESLLDCVLPVTAHAKRCKPDVTDFVPGELFDAKRDERALASDRAELRSAARQSRLLPLLVKARLQRGSAFETQTIASLQRRLRGGV